MFHSNFVPSVSQLDTNEVDAVAEADLYIAYGRDEQAEEILLQFFKFDNLVLLMQIANNNLDF